MQKLCFGAAQIKEADLNGVSLEEDKRENFNNIQQVGSIVIEI